MSKTTSSEKSEIPKPREERKRLSYSDFILKDRYVWEDQMHALTFLYNLQAFYAENSLVDGSSPLPSAFVSSKSIDANFEVYKMKRAILNKEPIRFNESIPIYLTEFASQVFILAMLHGQCDVVEYFLEKRIINPNCSMFRSPRWPSYYLFSCTCSDSVFSAFRKAWINYDISWFGLSPAILCAANRRSPGENGDLTFMSYAQFFYHNKIRGLKLLPSKDQFPIFPLDIACMTKDVLAIKRILDENPETGMLSRISFIVQCEEHILLILSRYGFSTHHNFNGNTPLHYSCYRSDFCTLSMLLYLGFQISPNNNGLYPNEVGDAKTREKISIFFNLCASTPIKREGFHGLVRIFIPQAFTKNMSRWMQVLNFKESEFDKYIGIFKYLDFYREHRIYKKSRFSIINVFGFSKTPFSVEKMVHRLLALDHPFSLLSPRDVYHSYQKLFRS